MCSDTQSIDGASTVGAEYVDPSATEILPDGAKVSDFFKRNLTQPYLLQRLTQRSYFFAGGFYNTTFFVGDEGVLVFDPPERQGDNLVAAVAEVTQLPITAIAYSHYHADHFIGVVELLAAAGATNGVDGVRLIASTATAEKMERFNSKLPRPTETVEWPASAFDFEGRTVRLDGFPHAAHCEDAASFLIVEEQVGHLPDLVNGDQPPFRRFAISENHAYYRDNVNQVGALDWKHLSGGHGNIVSKADISFYNTFLDDLEGAVEKGMASAQFAQGEDLERHNNHAVLMDMWNQSVMTIAVDELRPRYGQFYGFETSTPANAEMVIHSMISYR